VAAPFSTIDPTIASGNEIEIEERAAEEVTHIAGTAISPSGMPSCLKIVDFLDTYSY
jgi:methylthioribose-1-phosphate isomerase